MKFFYGFLLFGFVLISNFSIAQKKTSNADSAQFNGSLSYMSNDVYYGRADTLVVPYLDADLKYKFKSGIFVESDFSFLVSSYASRLDLFQLKGGYEKDINDHFNLSVFAAKDFYNSNSVAVSSSILGEAGGDLSFSSNALNAGLGTFISFTAGKSDVIVNLNLSHSFSDEKNTWSIEPKILANFGTRNYYDHFVNSRTTKNGKKNNLPPARVVTTVQAMQPNKFVNLDYEFSSDFYYNIKNVSLFFTPTYAIPQNANTLITTVRTTTPNGTVSTVRTTSMESISPKFYVNLGVYFKFR